ncbi:MAG: hypothetical protein KA270_02755 [Saprospiraceae bacterium]|nr:hypothetical protein [Saprospiraceae bacterium]
MKVGDTVRLNPLSRWKNGNVSNPIDTDGVIFIYQHNVSFGIEVSWDNGETNAYSKSDLVLVRSCEVAKPEEPVFDTFVQDLRDLIEKYKTVLIGVGEENKGTILVRMSDGLWTKMDEKGNQIGFYFSNKDVTALKKNKTVTPLDLDKQIHIDFIKNRTQENDNVL